jgi:hypothetical protein
MRKNWYQIDRRKGDGVSINYQMVRSSSLKAAITEYLNADGDYAKDWTITRNKFGNKLYLTARCPKFTEEYVEVCKVI